MLSILIWPKVITLKCFLPYNEIRAEPEGQLQIDGWNASMAFVKQSSSSEKQNRMLSFGNRGMFQGIHLHFCRAKLMVHSYWQLLLEYRVDKLTFLFSCGNRQSRTFGSRSLKRSVVAIWIKICFKQLGLLFLNMNINMKHDFQKNVPAFRNFVDMYLFSDNSIGINVSRLNDVILLENVKWIVRVCDRDNHISTCSIF